MASTSYLSRHGRGAVKRDSSGVLLGVRGISTTTVPAPFRLTCTRGLDGPTCQLLRHLEAFNKVLCHLNVHLQLDETGDVGDLLLKVYKFPGITTENESQSSRLPAVNLLEWLLMRHQCLVVVEICYQLLSESRLRRAIIRSPGVRKVHALNCGTDTELYSIPALIASMEHVDELVFVQPICMRNLCLQGATFGLSQAGCSLATLDVAMVSMTEQVATHLVAQLIGNKSVTTLAVSEDISRLPIFVKYLTKTDPTLRVLGLVSRNCHSAPILLDLVSAISTLITLEELTVAVDNGCCMNDVAIFAQVIGRSKTVKSVCMTWSAEELLYEEFSHHSLLWMRDHPENFEALMPRVRKFPVLKWLGNPDIGETSYNNFFRALALAQSRTETPGSVPNIPERGGVTQLCHKIRESGLAHAVLITHLRLNRASLPVLEYHPEVTAASVTLSRFSRHIPRVLRIFGSCSHISSVCFDIDCYFYENGFRRPLLSFIKRAVHLKVLCVKVYATFRCGHPPEPPIARSRLVKAISSHANLSDVILDGLDFRECDGRVLAEAAVRGPHLNCWTLRFGSGDFSFLQCLEPVAASSYNILRLEVTNSVAPDRALRAVKQVALRNSGLIVRAARFVMGDESSYCARALEIVLEHPKLVEKIQDRSGASCDEVKEMIRGALSRIVSMNQFMMAADVVKERVQCYARQDGETQLDELNEYCWLNIRKYLKVPDILEPPLPTV
ncbi:hypothetical protein V5799_020518 [Amblyomma americanum]|uniref:Nlr family card domain protein n=1 Tax=Amblyomma americanum TaxID=6943 RepID=A0AAQ4ETV1_AMBAM